MGDGGGGHWLSRDGVVPSRMVGVSASVNLPLHHKVQKFSSGTDSPGWSREKGCKTVVVVVVVPGHFQNLTNSSVVHNLQPNFTKIDPLLFDLSC